MHKGKMIVGGDLTNSCETKRSERQEKRKEFQTIARRGKKAFLCDQCKEIEENNRMGNTRDLFKKIRDTMGTFHAKVGTNKGQKQYGTKGSKDIKKWWQEYTAELDKKVLLDLDNHDGVIIHLEPDIPECEASGP